MSWIPLNRCPMAEQDRKKKVPRSTNKWIQASFNTRQKTQNYREFAVAKVEQKQECCFLLLVQSSVLLKELTKHIWAINLAPFNLKWKLRAWRAPRICFHSHYAPLGWPRCCIKVDGWCEKLATACRLARLEPNSKLAPELFCWLFTAFMLRHLRASSAPAPWIKSVSGGQEMENARSGRNPLLHSNLQKKKKKPICSLLRVLSLCLCFYGDSKDSGMIVLFHPRRKFYYSAVALSQAKTLKWNKRGIKLSN